MSALRHILLVMLALLGPWLPQGAYAAEETALDLERQVKSAYIFKFGNYVTWPDKTFADASSPMVIGIVEDELIAAELEKIAVGHASGNRSAVIKRLNANNVQEKVHVLYVAQDVNKYIAAYIAAHKEATTLFITDAVDGLNAGGIINFVQDNNRVRFDVSLRAMEQQKIRLDASLLTVARQVIK